MNEPAQDAARVRTKDGEAAAAMLRVVRILHVHTLPVVSGSGINTFLTMQGSRKCGAKVALACAPGGRLEDLVRRAGMSFCPIPGFRKEVSLLNDVKALFQLRRVMTDGWFDIVHTHNSKAGILGRMAARLVHTPVVIHTAHGFPVHKNRALLRLFLLLERLASRWCDRTIAISQPIIDWLIQTRIAEPGNLVKIFSGIETERFRGAKSDPALRRELGVADDQVAVGVVSKLWEGKGHEVLIDAFSLLVKTGRRVRLLIVGEGHLEAALQARVKRMGLDHCTTFTGFRSDIPEITAILDIAVLPSFYEGMGRVILEAMAAGKPVVASRVGGIVELVEEGVTGFLVPPGDSAALADRLDRLVSDPELRERFGRLAAKRTGEHFSAAAMVRQIHEVYCAELRRVSSGQARGRRCAGGRKG